MLLKIIVCMDMLQLIGNLLMRSGKFNKNFWAKYLQLQILEL